MTTGRINQIADDFSSSFLRGRLAAAHASARPTPPVFVGQVMRTRFTYVLPSQGFELSQSGLGGLPGPRRSHCILFAVPCISHVSVIREELYNYGIGVQRQTSSVPLFSFHSRGFNFLSLV